MNNFDAACSALYAVCGKGINGYPNLAALRLRLLSMLALAWLFGGKNAFVIGSSGGNQVKNDAGQFVGGSGDPGRPSQAGAHLAIKNA